MKEILRDLERWHRQGLRVALARVVDVEGSGPRLPGAAILTHRGRRSGREYRTPISAFRRPGGYAVALAASMRHIFLGEPGETFFSTSDIGWVVGHSYIVYGPLIAGMATIMYEGLPVRPDAGIWWSLVEKYKVTGMFSAPTAVPGSTP